MPKSRQFIDQDTIAVKNEYLNNICSDAVFLCNNKNICSENSSFYGKTENIDKICENIKKGNKCENDIDQCVVSVKNSIMDSQNNIVSSFLNIIVPIKNATDEYGNQKFLRLPPLSSSKRPGIDSLCNSSASCTLDTE